MSVGTLMARNADPQPSWIRALALRRLHLRFGRFQMVYYVAARAVWCIVGL